jgi:hypothetical protein
LEELIVVFVKGTHGRNRGTDFLKDNLMRYFNEIKFQGNNFSAIATDSDLPTSTNLEPE